jgi:hypothetical protein
VRGSLAKKGGKGGGEDCVEERKEGEWTD